MTSPTAAEAEAVATPAKPRTRQATAAKPGTAGKRAASVKPSSPEPKQELPARPPNRLRLAGGICVAAIASVALVYLLVGGDTEQPATIANDVPTVVSAGELAGFARSSGTEVYWAGAGGRQLELTTTPSGTFVRYRPTVAAAASLTVGTYPLEDAYATAVGRSRSEGMTSRRTADGGIAVWSVEQPTSVYLAWRGVPSLVEVYAPTAAEARSVALSGRVRPVRG